MSGPAQPALETPAMPSAPKRGHLALFAAEGPPEPAPVVFQENVVVDNNSKLRLRWAGSDPDPPVYPPSRPSPLDGVSMTDAIRATLHFDGASRGNPGPGGAGAVLAGRGRTIRIAVPLHGNVTNNVAEYAGLIAGLRRALELGVTHLEIAGDSELVVFQMTGRYRVTKEHLQLLHEEATGLVSRLKSVTWRTVPRELNAEADQQANLAADAATRSASH